MSLPVLIYVYSSSSSVTYRIVVRQYYRAVVAPAYASSSTRARQLRAGLGRSWELGQLGAVGYCSHLVLVGEHGAQRLGDKHRPRAAPSEIERVGAEL